MKICTPEQMKTIDEHTINQIGIPGMVLMENAAVRVVDEIIKSLGKVSNSKICVFAGKGNNGGDAFAIARHLFNKGASVKVYALTGKNSITGDAGLNLAILENTGLNVSEVLSLSENQVQEVENELAKSDIIVDGIFGTGLKGKIEGVAEKVIKSINDSGKTVISVDIPSGVNGRTGEVHGVCINAHKTVTFALPKIGLIQHPGCENVGELIVADIGIPEKVIDNMGITTFLTDEDYVFSVIPKRHADSNKGDYGKLLVISGSKGMTGAGVLSGSAALRVGAGLVYLGVPSTLSNIYDSMLIEAVTIPLEDEGRGFLSRKCIPEVLKRMHHSDVIAVGPGLSVNDDTVEVVASILENAEIPLVLDADALNAISRDPSMLKKLKTEAVITPHPGEMARLLGASIEEVQKNRLEAAGEFARKWNVVTVLKGSKTIIAAADGTIYINPTGNPGMATGGTGDVLTGIISALMGQGARPLEAAVAGAYLHGLAGDSAARIKGEHGLIARDIVNELPSALKRFIRQKTFPGKDKL